jgi:hypothetical protein
LSNPTPSLPSPARETSSRAGSRPEDLWPSLFFAVLFFLCSADQFFATRIQGYNFRWGQPLLLGTAIWAVWSWSRGRGKGGVDPFPVRLSSLWLPFFAVYGLAAAFSATPHLTFLKWGWGIFNIGCALWVCLGSRGGRCVERGFLWAVTLLTGLILFQAAAVYWFGLLPGPNPGPGTLPLYLPALPRFPFGFMQPGLRYLGQDFFRPNAFYYEPSYAGAALSFILPLTLMLQPRSWKGAFLPALVATSVFLCSSRTGILGALLSLGVAAALAGIRREKGTILQVLRTLLLAVLMVLAFSAAPDGRRFVQYLLWGPMGPQGTVESAKGSESSEGLRIKNFRECFDLWIQHPVLGNGVVLQRTGQGLAQVSMNTWLEIGIESGLLGLAAFLVAVLATMAGGLQKGWKTNAALWALGAWAAHFSVRYNLSQTFPRLDYWLLFFLSVRFLLKADERGEKT